ncbi:hypothetical protein ZMO01_16530 [Zymomonas mobilis subsp. mobilis]|nr:hypothetical protein ZMO01_16530 [Zymomonas mobilis subsp. mobilis]
MTGCDVRSKNSTEQTITADDSRAWIWGLLVRRNPTDGDLAYFTVWYPDETTLEKLIQVEGTRWRIEEDFRTAKTNLASITMKPAHGIAGIGTYHSS